MGTVLKTDCMDMYIQQIFLIENSTKFQTSQKITNTEGVDL